MVVLTASTSQRASWWWEAAQKEEVGSPLGGFLLDLSAQGAHFAFRRFLTRLLRSIFLSEDGRKMGRWRCPARVTALLLCKGWQEADAEKEEEQLLLAGDVQVTFVQSCVWQFRAILLV